MNVCSSFLIIVNLFSSNNFTNRLISVLTPVFICNYYNKIEINKYNYFNHGYQSNGPPNGSCLRNSQLR